MQDAIAEFRNAPGWAQIAMAFFAIMVVTFLVEPSLRRRKYRRKFNALARGVGKQPPSTRALPAAFPLQIDNRDFEVRLDLRSMAGGGSYRGPTGYLLITATRLQSNRWSMHQVDMSKPGRLARWLMSRTRPTGDAEFDSRIRVVEDGLPARDGWIDAPTRKAIAHFLDTAPTPGVLWIREGELTFTMQTPWKGVDATVLRSLLERQGTLAAALDRTAARP